MAEYIERDATIRELMNTYEREFPTADGAFDLFANRIVPRVIRNMLTVDAIEVVRCGECKYYDNPVCTLLSEEPSQYGSGSVVEMEYSDFCSYGERKE